VSKSEATPFYGWEQKPFLEQGTSQMCVTLSPILEPKQLPWQQPAIPHLNLRDHQQKTCKDQVHNMESKHKGTRDRNHKPKPKPKTKIPPSLPRIPIHKGIPSFFFFLFVF
jgi:hypothetical protein